MGKNIYILVDENDNKNSESFVKYTREYFEAKYGKDNVIVTKTAPCKKDVDKYVTDSVIDIFDADIVIVINAGSDNNLSTDTKFQVAIAENAGKKVIKISKDIEDFARGIQEINNFLGKKDEESVTSDDLWKVVFLGLTMFLG